MEELLFYQWVKVLIYLSRHQDEPLTLWHMSKELDIAASSSIVKIIKLFSKKGLLKAERKGRTNKYALTAKGSKLAEHLQKALEVV